MRGAEFTLVVKYRLGLPVYDSAGPCPACLRHSDVFGDHALCCGSGGERISRHNALRDALYETAVAAGLGPTKEGRFLLPGNDRRPADILVPHWSSGKDAAMDASSTGNLGCSCDHTNDEDDELVEEKKHASKAEAKRLKRVEEEEAARREQRVLDGEVEAPQTEEEFERLVVASPDSSLVWVQYMACCMQSGELERARAVARRALQRINFRLDEERLNIFLAWLNLENTFGTEDAMAALLKEALQCCDQYKVYTQLAAIYGQSGNAAEAEKIFKVLVRKFGKEKEVWVKFAIFYFKSNKLNSHARKQTDDKFLF